MPTAFRSRPKLSLSLPANLVRELEAPKLDAAVRSLLAGRGERVRRVLVARFGLDHGKPQTLQEIGDREGVTRERIRQIERAALTSLRSKAKEAGDALLASVRESLEKLLAAVGGVLVEDAVGVALGHREPTTRGRLRLLLRTHAEVREMPETPRATPYWAWSGGAGDGSATLEKVLSAAEGRLGAARGVLREREFFADLRRALPGVPELAIHAALAASKRVARTTFGEWGLRAWPEVTPRGVGDKAAVVLRRAGKPLHFRAITEAITAAHFDGKPVHLQTVHNELIRDQRFVLVGRGLYALKEWGHARGTVGEVALRILARAGQPLSKNELVSAVLKERLVKRNTVLLALHDRHRFVLCADGKVAVVGPPAAGAPPREAPRASPPPAVPTP